MKPFPYARLTSPDSSGITMRLKGKIYYRDCGDWSISFEIRDSKVFAKAKKSEVNHLDGREFIEITKEEWAKENSSDRDCPHCK